LNKKRFNTLNNLRYSLQTQLLALPWDVISVQQISKEANVSVGTFYNYFCSKDEALTDLKAELTRVLKNDLLSLLGTYPSAIDKITITVKYFLALSHEGSTWSNYLYSGYSFSDRLLHGIQDILLILILEGKEEGVITDVDVSYAVAFIESGVFLFSKSKTQRDNSDAKVVDLVLRMLSIPLEERNKVLNIACPVTPLMPLPIPILSTSDSENIYA